MSSQQVTLKRVHAQRLREVYVLGCDRSGHPIAKPNEIPILISNNLQPSSPGELVRA
jgi:hypothetical protein